MDRFLNEDNIVKKNNTIQNVLQKANILKQQTQQKINQLTPEQLMSIQIDTPIQMNAPAQINTFTQTDIPMQQGVSSNINNSSININENEINSLNGADLLHTVMQKVQQNQLYTQEMNNTHSRIDTQSNKSNKNNIYSNIDIERINNNELIYDNNTVANNISNDINTQSRIDTLSKIDVLSSMNNLIKEQNTNYIQTEEKKQMFDATNQLKTNNSIVDQSLNNNIVNAKELNNNQDINTEQNNNKSMKDIKKEILKSEKMYTPQEMLIKKQIQAYNELVNLQVELEIINRMSIRVEEKLRQSYNTKTYSLQIRIREQEIRLGVLADLLAGK